MQNDILVKEFEKMKITEEYVNELCKSLKTRLNISSSKFVCFVPIVKHGIIYQNNYIEKEKQILVEPISIYMNSDNNFDLYPKKDAPVNPLYSLFGIKDTHEIIKKKIGKKLKIYFIYLNTPFSNLNSDKKWRKYYKFTPSLHGYSQNDILYKLTPKIGKIPLKLILDLI